MLLDYNHIVISKHLSTPCIKIDIKTIGCINGTYNNAEYYMKTLYNIYDINNTD